jgi:hypothetical protein
MTGKTPGKPKQTGQVAVLGGAFQTTGQGQNTLLFVANSA